MTQIKPEDCPTPEYHETHRYCPSCTWVYEEPNLEERAEAAYLAECADYGVAWADLPEWKRESWRCEIDPSRDPKAILKAAARARP